MSNRKFNLENEIRPEIHFRLLSIASSKFENDWTSFPHSHRFTEIFFIKEGTGHMQIENKNVPVCSDSLVVIGAQVTHTEFSDALNPLDYYVLGVEGLKLNIDTEPEYIHVPASANSPFIRQCFENILREMHNRQDGYAEICQHYLAILILYFCRKDHVSYEVIDTQNSSQECHKVKHYIDHNYQAKISLDSLAENCSLSKYYLSHRFSKLYGKSPIAYLNEVRLNAAVDLLLNTNHSIEEISNSIGFSSTSYFSQSFQKKFHESPQQFRKSHRTKS